MNNPYDSLAPVYERWIKGDPACILSHEFYLRWLLGATGRIVEGGVGTGRIAIDLACRGQAVIGIDISLPMLSIARARAKLLRLDDKAIFYEMDLRQISLREIDVFFLPFRTIGHFNTPEERQQVFSQVFDCLAPGGKFIFDHYVPDLAWAIEHDQRPLQMFAGIEDAQRLEIWDTYRFDFERGQMDCVVEIREGDRCETRTLSQAHDTNSVSFLFSWLLPKDVRELALAAGFEIEALYGDFDSGVFTSQSEQQIWILRRPLGDQQ